MHRRLIIAASAALTLTLLAGCGAETSGASQGPSYKDMKSMVIDILKTEDAQKALQESATMNAGQGGFTALSVQDQERVRLTVKEALISPESEKIFEKLMTDPRFAGEFAKAVNKQNKEIHKELLKDPDYRNELVNVMKDDEMHRVILEVLKGNDFRKQAAAITQETMQSPLMKLQMYELMQRAVREELKPAQEKAKGGEGGQQGGQGGEDGEGEGEGEGGEENSESEGDESGGNS